MTMDSINRNQAEDHHENLFGADAIEKIKEIVQHADLQPFFNKENIIFNERPILHESFKNIKPDRVALSGNKAYIIDYKTGEEQAKYNQQITDYALAIEEMGYEIAKKTLLYIQDDLKIINLYSETRIN